MSTVGEEPRVVIACDFLLRYTTMLAAAIGRAGARVVLLTRDHDLEFGGRPGAAHEFVAEATAGADVIHLTLPGRVRSPGGWRRSLRIRGHLREFEPHVVHLQETVGNDVRLPIAADARRRRFAVTFHDPSPHPGDRAIFRDRAAHWLLARESGLIFVHSDVLRRELEELRAPAVPVVVVPHGLDSADRMPAPVRPNVLFFGRMSHYKGLDVLLDAMGPVWDAVPETILTIAGAGEIVDHPALADSRVIVRQGHVPEQELAALFNSTSCVVLPYRQASQSGVGSLAKSFGRPLVVTAVGGLPELVSDGSGVVVPPASPEPLAQEIVDILKDAGLAERLGAAGHRTARVDAGWDAVAGLTLAAYRTHLGMP